MGVSVVRVCTQIHTPHAQRTCTSSHSGALLWELVSAERPALEETPNSFGVCRL